MKASEDINNKQLRNVSVSGLHVFSPVVKKAEGDWLGPILSYKAMESLVPLDSVQLGSW